MESGDKPTLGGATAVRFLASLLATAPTTTAASPAAAAAGGRAEGGRGSGLVGGSVEPLAFTGGVADEGLQPLHLSIRRVRLPARSPCLCLPSG